MTDATTTFRLAQGSMVEHRELVALAPVAGDARVSEPMSQQLSRRPSLGCIKGWSSPPRGSALRKAALDMMRRQVGERFVVDEMRYFVGPDDAEVVHPESEVERWYVKGYTETEPQRRLRWLVRRARLGSGVDAVAPYTSSGYGPKTWTRLDVPDPSLSDPFQHPCQPSMPNEKCMGLPREVLGCLQGT